MSTMSAVGAIHGLPVSDADSLRDVTVARPSVGPLDVLVRVHAVSINPVDVKVRAGLPQHDEPRVLGWDAAGVIEEVGADVTDLSIGDEVWYAGDLTRAGSNADFQSVDSRVVARKPASLDWGEAAALPLTMLTAWESLFDHMRIATADHGTLLVVGGAGGVGSATIQLARALTDLTVLATASRDESRDWALELGAHHVVNHHALADGVLAIAPQGVDYVLSTHSEGNIETYANIVRPFGQITAIDDPKSLDLMPLKLRALSWHWELMFTRTMFSTPDIAEQGRILGEVAKLVDSGSLRTTVTTTLQGMTAETMREAHRLVETGQTIGKVVVVR
jgi:zinc-binding alcohol dehydrogenase family protein